MSPLPQGSARLRTVSMALPMVAVAVLAGLLWMTDLPARLGMQSDPVAETEHGHPHVGTDHAGHDHDEHGDHDHRHHGNDHDERHDHDDGHNHGHGGHDHPHDDHGGSARGHGSNVLSLDLSDRARANLGLKTEPLEVGAYTRYIEVPGVVTEWPGRTHVAVTSPLTGVLHSILVSRGELVKSGAPLFTLRLTHQDLVNTQELFLAKLGELDVEEREIERLGSITSSGAVAGKMLITRKYERDKLMAGVRAARQAMLLHGLTEAQINEIERSRVLIREVTVYAPTIEEDGSLHHDSLGGAASRMAESIGDRFASMVQPPTQGEPHRHVEMEFLVTQLQARLGQSINAGDELAQLSDFRQLLIEGQAFQRDAKVLRQAADTGADLQAVLDLSGEQTDLVDGLKVAYIGTEINRESRALPFYVGLANQIERVVDNGDQRFVSWQYKPGQRVTLRVPVSRIENAMVVPKNAVAEEGLERYLFVDHGERFVRVPVTVLARDSVHAAIENNGQIQSGEAIVIRGAHQLQMELRNRAGGAIDPHAGHNH